MIYTCITTDASTTVCTSDDYATSLSGGDILMGFFTFMIFVTIFIKVLYDSFIGIKQQNKKYD